MTDVTLSPYEAQDLLDSGFSLGRARPNPTGDRQLGSAVC